MNTALMKRGNVFQGKLGAFHNLLISFFSKPVSLIILLALNVY